MRRWLIGLLALTILVLGVSTAAAANNKYTVKRGDALETIARHHHTSVTALKKLNRLNGDFLREGMTLLIPVPDPGPRKPALAVPTPEAQSGSNVQPVQVTAAAPNQATEPSRGLSLSLGRKLVGLALTMQDRPYRTGGSGSSGFDCSGFVRWVYARFGYSLPHHSTAMIHIGRPVERSRLLPGDILLFRTNGARQVNHVGIYIGDGTFVHASSAKHKVVITNLAYYSKYNPLCGGRRLLPEP